MDEKREPQLVVVNAGVAEVVIEVGGPQRGESDTHDKETGDG